MRTQGMPAGILKFNLVCAIGKSSLLLALLLLAGDSRAGTFLGNGGGLAELQAIKASQSLRQISELCARSANSCSLISPLRKLREDFPDWISLTLMPLQNDLGYEWGSESGASLAIDPRLLYLDTNKAKPYSDIASVVYDIILQTVLPEDGARDSAITLLWELFDAKNSVTFDLGFSGDWYLHHTERENLNDLLLLELPDEAFDMETLFRSNSLCQNSAEFQRLDVSNIRVRLQFQKQISFAGNVVFTCARGNAITAKFVVMIPKVFATDSFQEISINLSEAKILYFSIVRGLTPERE